MQARDFLSTQPLPTTCEWCMCLRALLPVQDRLSNIFHYKYVNGARVYMLCSQYRTGWASPSRLQFKQEITSSSTCLSGTSTKSQFLLFLSPLICLWGIKISWYWSMYPFVLTTDQDAERKWQLPSRVLCERLPPLQAAKVASHPWIHFYVSTIVGISFLLIFSFSTSCEWAQVVKRVDFTRGSLVSPVCRGALQQLHQVISHWKMLLAQLHSNHTRTPSARWPEGIDTRGNTVQVFSLYSHSSKRSLPSYCCMWLICFSFQYSTSWASLWHVQQSRLPLHKWWKRASLKEFIWHSSNKHLPLRSASSNMQLENRVTFSQEITLGYCVFKFSISIGLITN